MKRTDPACRNAAEEFSRDCAALEAAFARYHGELMGTLYYMVGNKEDASDALQDTFLKCWRNRDKLSEVKQLKSWIFRIAMNTARDLRQTAWRRKRTDLAGEDLLPDETDQRPETILGNREEMIQLRAAIEDLRDEEKEVFLLRENGEMTYDEIGETLGLPTGTVKTRMRLAVIKLRSAITTSQAKPS